MNSASDAAFAIARKSAKALAFTASDSETFAAAPSVNPAFMLRWRAASRDSVRFWDGVTRASVSVVAVGTGTGVGTGTTTAFSVAVASATGSAAGFAATGLGVGTYVSLSLPKRKNTLPSGSVSPFACATTLSARRVLEDRTKRARVGSAGLPPFRDDASGTRATGRAKCTKLAMAVAIVLSCTNCHSRGSAHREMWDQVVSPRWLSEDRDTMVIVGDDFWRANRTRLAEFFHQSRHCRTPFHTCQGHRGVPWR